MANSELPDLLMTFSSGVSLLNSKYVINQAMFYSRSLPIPVKDKS